MSASLPQDCMVLAPIGVYRPEIPTCGPAVEEWLKTLDLPLTLNDSFEVMK